MPKPWSPDDVSRLHDLAIMLGGDPVPAFKLSESDFIDWCDPDVKAEWVDGEVILMSPEGWENVNFITWLSSLMRVYVEDNNLGVVMGREMLVRLPNQRRLRSPDMQFIAAARTSIIRPTFVDGAPDLVIESVSPSSTSRDWRTKHGEYEKAGIPEYWVFDPIAKHAEAYALQKNKRYEAIKELDGKISSAVLPGFYFRPKWFAAAKLPAVSTVLKELAATKRGSRRRG
jgi:Uma2 family endonuclease